MKIKGKFSRGKPASRWGTARWGRYHKGGKKHERKVRRSNVGKTEIDG
jgi:hypothetical protein